MKNSGFKDKPGSCLKCGQPLKNPYSLSAYCSSECEKQDEGYYTKEINSKIGAQK